MKPRRTDCPPAAARSPISVSLSGSTGRPAAAPDQGRSGGAGRSPSSGRARVWQARGRVPGAGPPWAAAIPSSSWAHPFTTRAGLTRWVAGRKLCPRRGLRSWLAQAGQTAYGVEVVWLQVQGLLVGGDGRVFLALCLADQAQARMGLRQGGRGADGGFELFGGLVELPLGVGHHAARVERLAARALLVVHQGQLLVSLLEVGNEEDRLRQGGDRFIQLSALEVGRAQQVPGVGVAPLDGGGLLQGLDGLIRLLPLQSDTAEIVVSALHQLPRDIGFLGQVDNHLEAFGSPGEVPKLQLGPPQAYTSKGALVVDDKGSFVLIDGIVVALEAVVSVRQGDAVGDVIGVVSHHLFVLA